MSVRVDLVSIRRARLAARAPQLAATATCVVLSTLGARDLLRPGPSVATAVPSAAADATPAALAGFAQAFARTWLSWDVTDPGRRERALARYITGDLGPGAGLQPAATGSSLVLAANMVDLRPTGREGWIATVATTSTGGDDQVLAVTVRRGRDGRLAVTGPPALVGPPRSSTRVPATDEREVQDGAVVALAQRALTNLLARDARNLRADLAPGARVGLPLRRLRLESVDALTWQSPDRVAAALITAVDDRAGVRMSLRYELHLTRTGRRPAVLSIVNPPTKETP